MNYQNESIDVVIPWVDGSDIEWKKEYVKYHSLEKPDDNANSAIRYQDLDILKYWFRSVENNMPWINRIFFITYGHIPDFLITDHPKLKVVRHDEYIPKKYLPVFSANPIEINLHRIKDLAENFIYFNDDVIPLQPIEEGYYFKNNIVCDEAVESPIMPMDIGQISAWSCWMKANDILLINKNFNKREVQKKNSEKWFSKAYGELLERNERLSYWNNFCGFHDPHMANAFHKSVFEEVWEKETDVMEKTSQSRFRTETDVNQYLIRYWQLCKGDFIPRKTLGKSYLVTGENYIEIANDIREKKYQMVSLNEDCTEDVFKLVKHEISEALEALFPEKSSYER